jgi:hypothetical protein
MLQDRNIHRDAQALRKTLTIPLIAPAFGVDQDEPLFVFQPRYNWRLSDLQVSRQAIATASLIVKVQAVPPVSAVGSPQLSQAAAVTFGVEEFWRQDGFTNTDFTNIAAIAAQAFTEVFTVLDGFWGVALVVVDQSNTVGVISNSAIQAFATEEIALANCPRPRDFPGSADEVGRVAILTINAVGGDFIAGTTNTDAALVAAFNTAPQDGHVATVITDTTPEATQSVLGQQLKDASGTNILQGRGGPTTSALDALVLSVRSAGAPVITGGLAVLEYRPWPAGGEGLGDTSVSQNRPSFVP